MPGQNDAHNLLLVSDLHIAAGLQAEAGESCHGLEAFLYDGAFARFLRYHEQVRRDAARRQDRFAQARARDEPVDEAAEHEAALLTKPWRLVLAGDVFDFWDVVRVPGDARSLQAALDGQIAALEPQSPAAAWLRELKMRLSAVQAGLKVPEWDYDTVREALDALGIDEGRQRRTIEERTWWTEVLVLQGAKLSRRTRRHGLGTTWQEVVWKLTLIYRGHREFFTALAWFIACGNDVVLIKGNHDIELHWLQVHDGHLPHLLADAYGEVRGGTSPSGSYADYPPELLVDSKGRPLPDETAFRQLLPAYVSSEDNAPSVPGNPTASQRFFFEDWYYCEPDLVYVEHGNQYEPADSSICFLEPTMPSDPSRIELPWGAFMVRYFYNRIVAVHPFAVSVRPEQRIIHWMIHHDLFRLLGIFLAELIDVVRGLVRAVKQGFRGTWIWGDHSLSGLIPLLIYDLIQIRIWLGGWVQEHRGGTAPAAPSDKCPGAHPEIKALSARTLLHLGALGTVLCLLLGGAGLLFDGTWTNTLAIPLGASAALAIVGAALSVGLSGEQGRHSLGELLLQIGVVGAVAAAIISLSVGPVEQWSPPALITIVAVFLVAAAAGGWLVWKAEKAKGGPSGLFRSSWQARCLRSAASMFLELGLLATLAGAYDQFWANGSPAAGPWLRAGLALFVAAWAAYRLHGLYVNQHRLESQSGGPIAGLRRGIRYACTVLVVLLAGGLILPPLAWLVGTLIQRLFSGGGPEEVVSIAGFANWLYEILTTRYLFDMPLLVALVTAMAIVILEESATQWLLERWQYRQLRPRTSRARRRRVRLAPSAALGDQQAEILELARAEQRRWLGGLLGMMTLFLPLVSLVLLVVTIAGGLAALLNFVNPFLKAVEPLKALGVSALFGLAYWLLRQISAARQRHDPRSGFGDLFYRMAADIASILAATRDWLGGPGLGQPRYFVFGHDHWADSKPLPRRRWASRHERQQWYVNTGTWLQGYVEEQRQQEVNENHSTFVQIIPGLGEDEAPRVLRWNDGAAQPEPIVRRKEPESTNEMIWTRWEGGSVWVLVWALLLALTWRLAPPGWMTELWPLVWILGLWLVSWVLVGATRWLLKRAQPQPAPDPANVTDIHCHVGLVGDQHPEWGQMSDEYRELPVFKAMLLYGRLGADQVCDAKLRASTEAAIAGSHVGHVVCLALDPVYDREEVQHKDRSYLWVANEYILELQRTLGNKVLLGASVHPYDPAFKERVAHYVNRGAVLLKWLPSAQQIDLADSRVRDALGFLAAARGGKPLPLLLHVGPEYAIPSTDPRTASYDYLTWTWWDGLKNRLRHPGERLYPLRMDRIHANLQAGLDAGAVIIFAHCGLPYYAPRWLPRFLEHSELRTIRRYLQSYPADGPDGVGRCYADVSALVTPFRRSYFAAIRRLPPQSLLFGSDFPTPVFELSAGLGEALEDLAAALEGELDRLLVPEDNLIDVNFRELQRIFPGHPMFSNFDGLLRFIGFDGLP